MSIYPDDCISAEEYVESLEQELLYYETVVSLLQHRLTELGDSDCICSECIKEFLKENEEVN